MKKNKFNLNNNNIANNNCNTKIIPVITYNNLDTDKSKIYK